MNHSRVIVQLSCGVVLFFGHCLSVAAEEPLADGQFTISPAGIDELIALLGDDEFRVREAATERLIQMGTSIIPGLQSGTGHHDREVRYRCERILRAVILRDRQERGRRRCVTAGHRRDCAAAGPRLRYAGHRP